MKAVQMKKMKSEKVTKKAVKKKTVKKAVKLKLVKDPVIKTKEARLQSLQILTKSFYDYQGERLRLASRLGIKNPEYEINKDGDYQICGNPEPRKNTPISDPALLTYLMKRLADVKQMEDLLGAKIKEEIKDRTFMEQMEEQEEHIREAQEMEEHQEELLHKMEEEEMHIQDKKPSQENDGYIKKIMDNINNSKTSFK
jgi:hypothetical protein